MKIYLTQNSYFTYRGVQSYALDILGKTCLSLMQERLCAEQGEPKEEEYILLDPVFPFLTREALLYYADEREGSYRFPGGIVMRKGPFSARARASSQGLGRGMFTLADYAAVLKEAEKISAAEHMACGAFIEDGSVVSFTAKTGAGALITAGARVLGHSAVGENAEIVGGELTDSEVGAGSRVVRSVLSDTKVGKDCKIGPFAYLRAGAAVGDGCRVGDFAEIKNARLGRGTKVAHLAYVGDADVGEQVNVGCGAVFANYDGKKKSRTVVGDRCFLGSNCNLIAPLRIGDGAFLAAGTTLTKDLDPDDFCIGRCRETVKPARGKGRYEPK